MKNFALISLVLLASPAAFSAPAQIICHREAADKASGKIDVLVFTEQADGYKVTNHREGTFVSAENVVIPYKNDFPESTPTGIFKLTREDGSLLEFKAHSGPMFPQFGVRRVYAKITVDLKTGVAVSSVKSPDGYLGMTPQGSYTTEERYIDCK